MSTLCLAKNITDSMTPGSKTLLVVVSVEPMSVFLQFGLEVMFIGIIGIDHL